MKIFIFGENGMLGRYVSSYLHDFYEVIKVSREQIDIFECFKENNLNETITELLKIHRPNYVINCSGVTNKRILSVSEMYIVNSYFPYILSRICLLLHIKLIHPSTDCIFSGKDGWYNTDILPDTCDDYGASKALAETIKACIIRGSIIGEDSNSRSLMEWVRENSNKTVNGFINHYWNGVTCLEYAKFIRRMIDGDLYWIGVKNIASGYKDNAYITKYDLVKEISKVYDLNVIVQPYKTRLCDRTLKPDFIMPLGIEDQIVEMKNYEFKIS
jgi:dTDP-4-dehydrorhamnose reductase